MSQFAFLKTEFAPVYELAGKAELAAAADAASNLLALLPRRAFRGGLRI